MKVEFIEGCMSYDIKVDGKFIMTLDTNEVIEKTKYFIEHLPIELTLGKDVYTFLFDDIMRQCLNVKQSDEIKYGEDDNEILFSSIINTKTYRIRILYENISCDHFTIIDDMNIEYVSYETLNKILLELLDEYTTNLKKDIDDDEIKLMMNRIMLEFVCRLGDVTDTYHCGQCGDTVFTYTMYV